MYDKNYLKEMSRKALISYWEKEIGQDYDSGSSMPEWQEIRKIIQAINEYDHDPNTCQHDFTMVMWGEEKGRIVCEKCGTEQEDDIDAEA